MRTGILIYGHFYGCVNGEWYRHINQFPETQEEWLTGEKGNWAPWLEEQLGYPPKENKVYEYFNSSM